MQAEFGLHWAHATKVAHEVHGEMVLDVFRQPTTNETDELGFAMCSVGSPRKDGYTDFKGAFTLLRARDGVILKGRLIENHPVWHVFRNRPFAGDWPELLGFVRKVIDLNFTYPPDLEAEKRDL